MQRIRRPLSRQFTSLYEVLEANGLLGAIGKLILIQQRAFFTNPRNGNGYQYGCSFCQYFHGRNRTKYNQSEHN